jgi:creatinine amidohydrolase
MFRGGLWQRTIGVAWHVWNETGRAVLENCRSDQAVAVLPIGASEQHGPHLPFGVDCILNAGLLAKARAHWGQSNANVDVFELPLIPVGKSDEHFGFAGTLNFTAGTMLAMLGDLGDSLHREGFRRVVIVSSHGGNSEVMALAARDLRVRHGMLALATSWPRMGLPGGLFAGKMSDEALAHDIHAGAIETALMLHLAPQLVDTSALGGFTNTAREIDAAHQVMQGTGRTGFAWATRDLSDNGVLGDPSLATAKDGAAIATHQVDRLCTLLSEVSAFDLSQFEPLANGTG